MLANHNTVRQGRARDERGAALAELALVMPLLLVLVLGMIDIGKAFNEWLDETHLANVGARLAAVNYCPEGALTTDTNGNPQCDWLAISITDPKLRCSDTDPNVCLAKYIDNYTDLAELKSGRTGDVTYAANQHAAQVCISYPKGSLTQHGDPVRVTVKIRYQWLKYLTNEVGLATTKIEGGATMRLETTPYVGVDLAGESCYPAAPAGT